MLKTLYVNKSFASFNEKLILYNYDKVSVNLFQNKFEKIFKLYNNYLLIQKGFMKRSYFFLNRHYLLSTSSQNYNLYKYSLLKLYFSDDNMYKYSKKKKFTKKRNMEGVYIWD